MKNSDLLLKILYKTIPGRLVLKVLTLPVFSKTAGFILDRRISKVLIRPFKYFAKIDMHDYKKARYKSFNDFFTRDVRSEMRPIDREPSHLISPCDGKLSVYEMTPKARINIKNSTYTLESILKNKKLAKKYENGTCLVIRLSVDNFHRYCYIDNGKKEKNIFIKGRLHTVNPIAFENYKVFKENSREYTILHTENFGDVIHMEVGALLVGRIKNHDGKCKIKRGKEKGKFEYGGSTIILFFEKDTVNIQERFKKATALGLESPVLMGEFIGSSK